MRESLPKLGRLRNKQAGALKLRLAFAWGGVGFMLVALGLGIRYFQSSPSEHVSTQPIADASASNSDAQLQPGRRELIENLIRKGYFEKVDLESDSPEVWVTPAFELIDFDQKQSYISVLYDYYATSKGKAKAIILRETLTGSEIGQYNATLGGLFLD